MPSDQVASSDTRAYIHLLLIEHARASSRTAIHARHSERHMITHRVTELEDTSLNYKGGNQDPETVSDLPEVI